MLAERRTAQTRQLANRSLVCTAESRLANQRLGCTAAGGKGSDITAAAGLTFCKQNAYSGIADTALLTVVAGSGKLCASPIINSWCYLRV